MFRYTIGFLFSEDEKKVALIRKIQPSWQKNKLNGPGGKIEEGESPKAAMIREFKEETGVYIENWREFCVLSGTDWQLHAFSAFSNDIFNVKTQESEQIGIFNVNALSQENTIDNLRWLIPMALDQNNVYAIVTENLNKE